MSREFKEDIVRYERKGAMAANSDEIIYDEIWTPSQISLLEIASNTPNNVCILISPYNSNGTLLDTIKIVHNDGGDLSLFAWRPDNINSEKSSLWTETVFAAGTYKGMLNRELYFPWGVRIMLRNSDAVNPHNCAVMMHILIGRRGT